MASQNFYILVPESPFRRKRKLSRSPSPAASSTRVSTPNSSPTKKQRFLGGRDVESAASKFSNLALSNSPTRQGSDFDSASFVPSDEDALDEDIIVISDSDDDSDVFQLDAKAAYVDEESLECIFHESSGRGIPIRRLRQFTIFSYDNFRLIPADALLHDDLSNGIYGASGIVDPVEDDDSDDDSSSESSLGIPASGVLVESLRIKRFTAHDFDALGNMFDEHIYIETDHAWYILDEPSDRYEHFWRPLWTFHRFAHLVLTSALREPQTTKAEFVDSLESADESEVLTKSAFESDKVVAYITSVVQEAIATGVPIGGIPLTEIFVPSLEPTTVSNVTNILNVTKSTKKQADAVPLVTPVIKRVLEKHLTSPTSVVGAELEEASPAIAKELHDVIEHHDDPQSMRWVPDTGEAPYTAVEMDGVVYKVGDIVAVNPGTDANEPRDKSEKSAAAHCINKFANCVWFCQITRFFESGRQKMFHCQWLTHGSRTILQETAHSNELFLLAECSKHTPVASIIQKCRVRFPSVKDVEEIDHSDPDSRNYFCRFLYDENQHSFTDLPSLGDGCPNCDRLDDIKEQNDVRFVEDGLALHGHLYHEDDYVYVKPNSTENGRVLFIARILTINFGTTAILTERGAEIKPLQLRVRYYDRDPDHPRKISSSGRTNCVDAQDLDGICFVYPFDPHTEQDKIDTWVDSHPDHFHIDKASAFKHCTSCLETHVNEMREAQTLSVRLGKIPVLEVFSGAGGLSQGLGQSGFFQTGWAVEKFVAAAKTFALNHPETHVLPTDISQLLRYSVELLAEKKPSPLMSSDSPPVEIPDENIPKPGQVGLVCGGPPCQSFSGANSNKREDDPRSSLPFTMLSVAEVYEPNLFLLENVTGLLQHSVTSKAGDGQLVKKAMLKLIIRGLLALNYQVHFKVLQAAQYGSPQNRERVIFLGAKIGCKLPDFPIPTHAFSRPSKKYKLFMDNDSVPLAKRGRGPEDDHSFAPHAQVTIDDATSDLPAFDWVNPHVIMKQTADDIEKVNTRNAQGIQQFTPRPAPVGFADPIAYASPPTTPYQRLMRRDNKDKVEYHFTDQASPFPAEASATVPLKPFANHLSLPTEFFDHSNLKRRVPACFGRLNGAGYFQTAVTSVQPRSRGSYVLHPHQYRPISVAEAKRAQGFPDSYILWSDAKTDTGKIKNYYRHIGNAVPVPLAAALGRSLEAAFVETARRISTPREESREL
ncbi:BAH domain-containing protein [Favolaschia claudopus]|uniref:DNA (cytosine-5-)-methyltransferase n=1 Tax=Favolaschia claudopus TaxID=2862362 RepID=A0AAW0CG66_9AGAR